MSNHLTIFRGTGAGSGLTDLTPVADSVIPALGDQLQLPKRLLLVGAASRVSAAPTGTGAAWLQIPSWSELGTPALVPPFDATSDPTTIDLTLHPIPLQLGDPVGVAVDEAITFEVALFFADELQCPGPEPVAWVPYAAAAPAAASIATRWQAAELTLQTRLPAGRYRVLSIRHRQSYVVAARLVFPGQVWRPGAMTLLSATSEAPTLPAPETTGVLGEFDAIAPPSLELFQPGAGAPAAGGGFLLLQRVAAGVGSPKRGCGGGKAGGCGCGGGQ